ncbi:hypothetical protein INT43_004227 [Umbelopsis isabellina]|uniref:Uncharacterized protein n=1 Tax=Mortierella isabellina TaxID=91625 RepID=A0A8H7PHV1_MORIS|nr:hypothetical protein INT43_004227 [Umbelopsis isabellina]
MATMERKKRQTATRIAEPTEDASTSQPLQSYAQSDLHDGELAELASEPIEYNGLDCVLEPSPNSNNIPAYTPKISVKGSLKALRTVCLRTLNSLLRKMVSNTIDINPMDIQSGRRLSDPFDLFDVDEAGNTSVNLFGAIDRQTEAKGRPKRSISLRRCESSPAFTNLSDARNKLDTYHLYRMNEDTTDYQLGCALAALLNNVYVLLEEDSENIDVWSSEQPSDNILDSLKDRMLSFRKEHTLPKSTNNELASVWEELDRLMDVVATLAVDKPPQYEEFMQQKDTLEGNPFHSALESSISFTCSEKLPPYEEKLKRVSMTNINDDEKARKDLDNLLSVIDRVSSLSPRLNNQRVELNERQAKEMAMLAIGKAIERISARRLDEQRAYIRDPRNPIALQQLLQLIHRSADRSLVNQRAEFGTRTSVSESSTRTNTSPETVETDDQLWDEVAEFAEKISRSSCCDRFNEQRYQMSSAKERAIFMNDIVKKVDKLQHRRLDNQDAVLPVKAVAKQDLSHDIEPDLFTILERTQKRKSQFDNQRATLSPTSCEPKLFNT